MINKNKILILISLLFIFNINNLNASEQFNFDVTELEISDNGNIIKGYKRGTATTQDGLKIEADNFHYEKELNILNAYGNVKIIDSINDYIILSENITYIKNQEKIFTNGITEAIIESRYEIKSKNVLFLKNEMILSSSEKSTLKDRDLSFYKFEKFRYFLNDSLLKGKKIEIINNYTKSKNEKDFFYFDDGIINIKSKDFIAGQTKIKIKKNIFDVSKNDPRIYGVSSNKKNEITTINKGVFTSCESNDKCPPWSISSSKILHDQKKKQIIYKDALLKVYDVPVLYFPKFFHPDPTVERQSGFLQPRINNSNILGTSFNIPYFHVISQNKDLTFTPSIFDKNIYMIQNEYREENKRSSFISDLGYTKGYKSIVTDNKKKDIGHLFAKLNLDLNFESFKKSDLNLSLEQVTNDTYLKVFETNLVNTSPKILPKDKGQLTSTITINLDHEKYAFDAGMTAYEKLEGTDSDRYQYRLPYYSFSRKLISNELLSLDFQSNGNNSYQNTNNIKSEVTNNFDFKSLDFFSDNGFKNNLGVYFKNVNTVGKNDVKYKSSPQVELSNIVNFETSWPLIKESLDPDNSVSKKMVTNSLIPKLSFRINPTDMRNYSDSDILINTDNIFSINRLAMSDSYEAGKSLTLGIDYKKETSINDINRYFELNLASVLRDVKQDRIPIKSTLGEKQSNLFGSTNYNISELLSLNYDFALDNDFHTFEYNSIGTQLRLDKFITNFDFVETNGKMGDKNFISNTTTYRFNEDNYLTFKTRRNRKISLTEYYDLVYEYKNDCLIAGIKYKKTFYQDRDLLPAEDLFFSITLFPLTKHEQKIDNSLYN